MALHQRQPVERENPALQNVTPMPRGLGRGNGALQDAIRARLGGRNTTPASTEGQQVGPGEAPAGGEVAAANTIPAQYANKSEVWKQGYRDGLAQGAGGMRNIEGDAQTQGAIRRASGATGVAEDNLTAMSIIESTGNRNVGTNAFGYTGLMQMGRDAATDVGMSYSSLQGGGNVNNNALAGARYWNVNARRLDEDIPRDPLHMYLAHQQGATGTNNLMRTLRENPGAAAHGAQRNNLPETVRRGRRVTQQDFYDYWAGKMQAIQDTMAARRNARG